MLDGTTRSVWQRRDEALSNFILIEIYVRVKEQVHVVICEHLVVIKVLPVAIL